VKRIKLTREEALNLLILREGKGLKIIDAAKCLGIHRSTLREYERAVSSVPLDTFKRIEKFYDVSLEHMGTIIKTSGFGVGRPQKITTKNTVKKISEYEINSELQQQSRIKNHQEVVKLLKSLDDFL
jgi:transcriptional regulator with XRE-family HTH domain